MLDGNSAALKEHDRSMDKADATFDAFKERAVQSIIEDFLLVGWSYPRIGGRRSITAGKVLVKYLDGDDLDWLLDCLVYGHGESIEKAREFSETAVRQWAPTLLEGDYEDLIERRVEELEEDEDV